MYNYRVIGIVQSQVKGQWNEAPVIVNVRADNHEGAKAAALDSCTSALRSVDPLAIVRWNTPNLVRVQRI